MFTFLLELSRTLKQRRRLGVIASGLLLLGSVLACRFPEVMANELEQGPPTPPREVSPGGKPTPQAAAEPDETLLALGDLFDAEGRLPLETALQVFAGTVAPLPGVTPRSLPGENQGAA